MKTTMLSSLFAFLALSPSALAVPVESAPAAPPASPSAPAAPAPAQTTAISYDPKYDQGTSSLTTVSCSDGVNGLISKGYSDFKSLPGFPLIGGAPTVEGWDSPNCGKCYQIHYKAGNVDKTINVLAVDVARGGFNLGLQAMNQLTNGLAEQLGRVQATYSEVDQSQCA